MTSLDETPEELARLPLDERVAALAQLVERLEKRLEATGLEGESKAVDAQGQTPGHLERAGSP